MRPITVAGAGRAGQAGDGTKAGLVRRRGLALVVRPRWRRASPPLAACSPPGPASAGAPTNAEADGASIESLADARTLVGEAVERLRLPPAAPLRFLECSARSRTWAAPGSCGAATSLRPWPTGTRCCAFLPDGRDLAAPVPDGASEPWPGWDGRAGRFRQGAQLCGPPGARSAMVRRPAGPSHVSGPLPSTNIHGGSHSGLPRSPAARNRHRSPDRGGRRRPPALAAAPTGRARGGASAGGGHPPRPGVHDGQFPVAVAVSSCAVGMGRARPGGRSLPAAAGIWRRGGLGRG